MKRFFLFTVIVLLNTYTLTAQTGKDNFIPTVAAPYSLTEAVFNKLQPSKSKANFQFYFLTNNSKFDLELSNASQLYSLPNIDSIVIIALQNIKPLIDSFKNDGIVRRLDYVAANSKPQIRIIEHTSLPNNYLINADNITQLKIEQDTLRIKAYTVSYSKYAKGNIYVPFFITILANNFINLFNLPNDGLTKCIDLLKNNLKKEAIAKNENAMYYAAFNMKENRMFSPSSAKWIAYNKRNNQLVPNVYAGLQYLQGNFNTSFAAGLRYSFGNTSFFKQHVYAMWEPYFFFSNNSTFRNDFVTLRYIELEKNRKVGFEYITNFSIGYLVNQRGNYFKDNTIKLGLPAVRSGWLQVEPELLFTGFFKNFSPGLRLTLHYE